MVRDQPWALSRSWAVLPFLDESRVQSLTPSLRLRYLQKEKPRDLSSRWPGKCPLYHDFGRPVCHSSLLRTQLRQPHCPPVRLFPFTLPNLCLPISSTPMATSIPSTIQTKLPANVRPPRPVTSPAYPCRARVRLLGGCTNAKRYGWRSWGGGKLGMFLGKVLGSRPGSVHHLSLRRLLGVLRWRRQHYCSSGALALTNSAGSFSFFALVLFALPMFSHSPFSHHFLVFTTFRIIMGEQKLRQLPPPVSYCAQPRSRGLAP